MGGLGIGLSLAFSRSSGNVPQSGAVYEDFSGGAATLMNGLTVQPYGGATWLQNDGNSGSFNTPQITAGGKATGSVTGSYNNTSAHLQVSGAGDLWIQYATNPTITTQISAVINFPHQFNIIGAGDYSKMIIGWTPGSGTGSFAAAYATTGLYTSNPNAIASLTSSRVSLHGGDVVGIRKRKVAAQVFYDTYINGWNVGIGTTDMAAVLPAITDRAGLPGNMPNTGPIDSMEVGDPAASAMIWVVHPGKIASRKFWASSNDVLVNLRGFYSGTAPTSLVATVVNADTEANITGYVETPLSSFTASGGVWTGNITIAAADAPDSLRFFVRVARLGLIASAKAFGHTPVLRPGVIVAMYGQSLMTELWQTTTAVVFTPPANGWSVDGSTDGSVGDPTTSLGRRVHAANTTSTLGKTTRIGTYMQSIAAGLMTHSSIEVITGGQGGQDNTKRVPGDASGIYSALSDGILMARDVTVLLENGGTFEITDGNGTYGGTFSSAQAATYKTQLVTIVQNIEAQVGHAIFVILGGCPAVDNTGNDSEAQQLARARWELTQDNGGLSGIQRFYQGGYGFDVQHKSLDQYHLVSTAGGYPEIARRYGYDIARVLGYTTASRLGPTIAGVVRDSATSITVNFNLNGASAVEVANTAYASIFNGGLWFSDNDTAFGAGNIKQPTAVTINAVVSLQQSITFTFAANSFPSTCYVRGPWGQNPFNRTNDATTNADKLVRCSMVRGVFAAEPFNIPVQPYFSSGNDYFTAS